MDIEDLTICSTLARKFATHATTDTIYCFNTRKRGIGDIAMRRLLLFLLAGSWLFIGCSARLQDALANERSRLESNKVLVRRMHAAVWSEANMNKAAEAIRQLYAADFVVHDWTGDHKLGIDGLIKDWAYERAAFLGLTEHVQATVAEGDLVVDRFYSTGRQARDLDPIPHHSPGIPNRGKALHMPEMEMFRVVDGKLAEQWLFNDIWGTHAQLGLFDPDNWKASICAPK
jgi:predicted ester cyclase